MPRNTNHPTNEKLVKKDNLTPPLSLAWIFALIAAVAPFLIVFNLAGKWSLTGTLGISCLTLMVMILVLFLADAIVSRIKIKPLWVIFLLLCPTIAQIVYLIFRKKILIQ